MIYTALFLSCTGILTNSTEVLKDQSVKHLWKCMFLFSHDIMSDSLWPHGLQHDRLPCPSTSPRVCSNSCSLSWWWRPTISSSFTSFFFFSLFFYSQCFPASGSFPVSQLFTSGGQSTGAFPLGLTCLISLLLRGPSRVLSNTTVQKHQFFGVQPSLWPTIHIHTWLLEKPELWLDGLLLAKWCFCCFNILFRFVILFFQGARDF